MSSIISKRICCKNHNQIKLFKNHLLLRKYNCSHQVLFQSKRMLDYRGLHLSSRISKQVPFILADIGEGIKEVIVKEWFVKEGDKVFQFDNICEVQSDKASVTITSRYDGVVHKIHHEVDGTALVGEALIDVQIEKEDSDAETQESEAIEVLKSNMAATEDATLKRHQKILTTPAVRRVAVEHNIDLSSVNGTGRDGRILKEDVFNYIKKQDSDFSKVSATSPIQIKEEHVQNTTPPPLQPRLVYESPQSGLGEDKTIEIKGYKKAMVKTMTSAMRIPHFGYCDEIDVSEIFNIKTQFKSIFEAKNLKFTFLPIFMKALSMSLVQFPDLNAWLHEDGKYITYKASHNIGVAMDTKAGLVVPNIKAVQSKSILDIAAELSRLSVCGQQGNFSPQDLSGGTITVSNVGSIGGTYAKPLMLSPEVAIVALGKIQKLPRYDANDNLVPTQLMSVSWSADHRVIDGATVSRFCNKWKSYLENPATMIAEMI